MKYPKFLSPRNIPVGAPGDFPVGSVERARLLSVKLLSTWELRSVTEREWANELGKVKAECPHVRLGFKDFDAYLTALIGETEKGSRERYEAKDDVKRGNPTGNNQYRKQEIPTVGNSTQPQRAKANGRGIETQRWLDRLARDRPDLLEKVNAGELKPKTAARQAGIIREPTAFELIKKAFAKLSAKERRQFITWLKTQS